MSTAKGIKKIIGEYKARALDSAKTLGLQISDEALAHFVRSVQSNKTRVFRRLSKDTAIHLIYMGGQRYYAAYNNRYKLIVGFLAESDAKINRYDLVVVWQDNTPVSGKVEFIVREYDDPKKYLGKFERKYDVSDLRDVEETARPQFSFLVIVPGKQGGKDKIIWPPASALRKLEGANGTAPHS